MRVSLHSYELPFVRPLATSKGTFHQRTGMVVRVVHDGVEGVGEAAPLPGFSEETLDEAHDALREWSPRCPQEAGDAEGLACDGPPSARHGAEQALLGWLAAQRGTTVAKLLGARDGARVRVNALVADADQAEAAVQAGFDTVKVKVGRASVDDDVRRVRAIRRAVGPEVALRLDANRGWQLEEAEVALRRLGDVGIELIEEPTRSLEGLASLRGLARIGADESVRTEADLEHVLEREAADVVVVKPMLVGSLLASVRMLRRLAATGRDSIVTTSLEGGYGRCGAWAVAAAGPASLACGLDTGSWLQSDVHPGPAIDHGWATGGAC